MCEWLEAAQGTTNCADCNSENPKYYNPNYQIFVCMSCAQIHEEIQCKRGTLKSQRLEVLSEGKKGQAVRGEGNVKVNGKYERFLPLYYPKQGDMTPPDIRKEFITHKYVKETFCTNGNYLKYTPASGGMEGVLEKKGKDKSLWKSRHFVLTPVSIKYFLETGQSEPKSCLPVSQLEIHLEMCDRTRSCLVLTHLSDSGASGRKYYVRTAGGDLLFDWYFALLTAQSAKDSKHRGTLSRAVVGLVSQSKKVSKSGQLYKVGTHSFDIWRKRWFSINASHVTYSANKLSALPQGDFMLGPDYEGYAVEMGATHKMPAPTKYTFQLVTPDRTYKLCADTYEDRESWMYAFNCAIENIIGDNDQLSNSI
ncbi:Arf-GAP with dual PH domain-containing protein 1-like [Oopsacas minuta]|uniref:Arf-GAP with dual PH domain-containing protein 1-like n=1 Tax=Oopsacas minuta TaxID=111878 RepID=A0AAV7K168_9METZ|nr:Arf-GAP with dual PH domain-containing protein 1-like [Oopsacas minuta]